MLKLTSCSRLSVVLLAILYELKLQLLMTKLISLIMIHLRGAEQLSGVHDPSRGGGGGGTEQLLGGEPLLHAPL